MRISRRPVQRHVKGKMNGTEREYYQIYIRPLELTGEVIKCEFETLSLKLGKRCFYNPDFILTMRDESKQVHEVKGGLIRDDARVKYLWACEKYGTQYIFQAWQKKKGLWKQIWN